MLALPPVYRPAPCQLRRPAPFLPHPLDHKKLSDPGNHKGQPGPARPQRQRQADHNQPTAYPIRNPRHPALQGIARRTNLSRLVHSGGIANPAGKEVCRRAQRNRGKPLDSWSELPAGAIRPTHLVTGDGVINPETEPPWAIVRPQPKRASNWRHSRHSRAPATSDNATLEIGNANHTPSSPNHWGRTSRNGS